MMHAVFSYKQACEIIQLIFIIPSKVVLSIRRQGKGCKMNTEKSSEVKL